MGKDMGRERLLGYWKGILLFLAVHGWKEKDERAVAITKLIEQSPESGVDEELGNIIGWINRTLKGWYSQTRADINEKIKQGYRADIVVLKQIKQLLTQKPQIQEGVKELIRKTWEKYATLAPRGVMSPPSKMIYLQFEEAVKQLLQQKPQVEQSPDSKPNPDTEGVEEEK